MITKEKLKIYIKYSRDIDSWVRCASNKEKHSIEDNEWFEISNIIQDLQLKNKGLTSSKFNENLDKKLKSDCDNQETVEYLNKIALNL